MKKYILPFAILALLFACTPDENKSSASGGTQNNPNELIITGDVLDVTDYSATLTGYANLPFELGDAEVGVMYDKNQSFEDAQKVVATGLDGNNKFIVDAIGLSSSTTYYYKSYVQNGMAIKYGALKSFTTKEKPKRPDGVVDLGIVMTRENGSKYKLYWAKSNLCDNGLCANPWDYGDYYAWGETASKSDYSWSTYKFRTSGDTWENVKLSKYNTKTSYGPVDNITELQHGEKFGETVDDVARAKLGGRWRIPTKAEWREIWKYRFTRTNNYNGTGVKGLIVTATNGNKIFLPNGGAMDDTGFEDDDDFGMYWTSSLDTKYPSDACDVVYNPEGLYNDTSDRSCGLSVRPVWEENEGGDDQNNPDELIITSGEAVDLGLSVKWSSTNLGALMPEGYGAYFAWGETEPKADYSWATYKWCNGSSTTITKYCTDDSCGSVDNMFMLERGPNGDDPASAKLGGCWRMPTIGEWRELRENCTWEEAVINGVNGRKITSKIEGYTNNWIFLPSAGFRIGTSLSYSDSNGFYWSSSLSASVASANFLNFYPGYANANADMSYRFYGNSIRPVYDEVSDSTVKEVMNGPEKKYRVTGVVTKIHGAHYGNMYINDGTVDDPGLQIYGTLDKKGNKMTKDTPYDCISTSENAWDIAVGDKVTVEGPMVIYFGAAELVDVTIIKIEKALVKVIPC